MLGIARDALFHASIVDNIFFSGMTEVKVTWVGALATTAKFINHTFIRISIQVVENKYTVYLKSCQVH